LKEQTTTVTPHVVERENITLIIIVSASHLAEMMPSLLPSYFIEVLQDITVRGNMMSKRNHFSEEEKSLLIIDVRLSLHTARIERNHPGILKWILKRSTCSFVVPVDLPQ